MCVIQIFSRSVADFRKVPNPRLRVDRVENAQASLIKTKCPDITEPIFCLSPAKDSGIWMPDLNLTDEKILGKYGLDLTANFADIRAYGTKAFFQKVNPSDGNLYSLCACATGYIWVKVTRQIPTDNLVTFANCEVQIGTFALKTRAITTREIPFRYAYSTFEKDVEANLSLLFSTVLAKYLRSRIIGQQYEDAVESAIRQSRKELAALEIVNPGRYDDFDSLLRDICLKAPLPPTSDVSLISRSMITRRWEHWRDRSVLRKRYSLPQRIFRCFQRSRFDSTDLLSGCYNSLKPDKTP